MISVYIDLTPVIETSTNQLFYEPSSSRCLYVEDTGDECTQIAQSWKTKKEETPKETEEPADGKPLL